jgi:primosomal protein N' (replication factor Y)
MIAKGLDFPSVTTVGVVNADVALHLPDFRSRERTFQLLAQVAGRTGRGPAGGRVIVQTFMPEDPSIRAAVRHDYEAFAEHELPARRQLRYPPFGRMVRIICRGRSADRVETYTAELGRALRSLCREADDGSQVLGPAPAPVSQIRGRWRYHLMVKCPDSSSVRRMLEQADQLLRGPSGLKVLVDVDPVSML